MSVREVLEAWGGVGERRTLVAHTSRAEVDRALSRGDLVADARGRYALPDADEALRAANQLGGLASHLSAARLHGWELREEPAAPHVTIPKGRTLTRAQSRGVVVHRADLMPDDRQPVPAPLTSASRTLIDCLRSLDFADGLALADSALRHRALGHLEMIALCDALAGPGAAGARRVAHAADARAANPFESTLRAHALEVGLDVVPQLLIGGEEPIGRPDLVDLPRRLVLEADSFAWHGSRGALQRDAERYNAMTVAGFTVLRFSWEDVMHHADRVREVLRDARDRADRVARTGAPRTRKDRTASTTGVRRP